MYKVPLLLTLCLCALNTTQAASLNPQVEVYKSFGTVQCQRPSKDDVLTQLKGKLTNSHIQVYNARVESKVFDFPQVCGKISHVVGVFTIPQHQLALSQKLGYSRYVPR
jgi:hypothetical protein